MVRKLFSGITSGRIFKKSGARRHEDEDQFLSGDYWEHRYHQGGNSGAGSYGRLADFKAEVLNPFVAEAGIQTVVEFGPGDGNQLSLAEYPNYLGVDVSTTAVEICRDRFNDDVSKTFLTVDEYDGQKAELALSLDVIFHLVEDGVFEAYMDRLFAAAEKYVIIYSSNKDERTKNSHVRHRKFSNWIDRNASEFSLIQNVPNAYPFDRKDPNETSFAEFFFYEKE